MYRELAKKRAANNKAKQSSSGGGNGSKCRSPGQQGKNRKWVLVGCIVGCFCVLAGIGTLGLVFSKEKQESSTVNQEESTDKIEKPTGKQGEQKTKQEALTVKRQHVIEDGEYGPKIKGLRLGMKYKDVEAIVERLCDQHNSKHPRYTVYVDHSQLDTNFKDTIFLRSEKKDTGNFCPFRFYDGRLVEFGLNGEIFQLAFDVKPNQVSDEEIAQMFLDSYGIPSAMTRTFTFTNPYHPRLAPSGGVETLSYYDGSENGGYSFEFRGFRGTGDWIYQQNWSFTVRRYLGFNFDLPEQISMLDVKNYQHGFGPVIKGFQLGMTRSEVLKSVKKIWNDATPTENGECISFMRGSDLMMQFVFKSGVVSEFRMAGDIVIVLFRVNPHYQDIKEFTRRAINFYNIPEVRGRSRSSSREIATCYDHRMRDEYTGKIIEFWIEEIRRPNAANWTVGCRQVDISGFD